MTRRLTSSPVVHMAALSLLCSMLPWSLEGLPLPYWIYLVTCLTCLRTLNMVTNPLYHTFKCMLEQEGPSFPVTILPQTAAWTQLLPNRNHPSPASLLICGSLHSVCTGATVAAAVLLGYL
jgi:hypothetical protein